MVGAVEAAGAGRRAPTRPCADLQGLHWGHGEGQGHTPSSFWKQEGERSHFETCSEHLFFQMASPRGKLVTEWLPGGGDALAGPGRPAPLRGRRSESAPLRCSAKAAGRAPGPCGSRAWGAGHTGTSRADVTHSTDAQPETCCSLAGRPRVRS